jgi:hypothetical protein
VKSGKGKGKKKEEEATGEPKWDEKYGHTVGGQRLGVSLLDETDCWGIKVPNILGTRFDIESKYLLRIPELPLKVCSGEKMMNQIKDFFNKNRLVEYASGVWEAYDKGIKSVWSNSYDPAYGKSWDPSQFKEVEDGLIVGPKCSGETVGIQLTISIGAEFAYIAGAGASAEYGYQIGCMDGLKAKHGSKNYVIVKLWGMNAGLRLGKGGNIGLGGNLFLYKPFNYWKHFGQELSIGYKMSLTKSMDFDVDMIFGCCDNPLKKASAPVVRLSLTLASLPSFSECSAFWSPVRKYQDSRPL